jgi:glutaredoxin
MILNTTSHRMTMMNFLILSKENCVWCDKAKMLIKEMGDDYVEFSYKSHPVIVLLMKEASLRTLPQIWAETPEGKVLIGGHLDLVNWYSESESYLAVE